MPELNAIIQTAADRRASDIHIAAGLPVRIRVDGALVDLDDYVLTPADCESLARQAAGDAYESIAKIGELDMADTYTGHIRCRLNIYHSMRSVCLAIRILSDSIPELGSLGLPPVVMDFPTYQKGIVLVTGETGSGKSTTLASILNTINQTRPDHIITLEDPIEYVYEPQRCSIDQREIGRDTVSYAEGLRAILREDPDVILIGEMRDLDTIETALTAAETGHLVFGTLHTQSAADSIDRLVDVFPEGRQRQIRLQLSMVLRAVISQQLLPRAGGEGRAAACEVMIVNPAIRNLIREGKTPQIQNTLATTAELGAITMDNMLVNLVRSRTITRETAIQAAHDPDFVKRNAR
ncbi:MAG: type IV pilus twitching motility protein PilT [Eggerthellaceae bacterium]|nr:type IV pilus twitching motility protein PilT [Eggerthellaceae bacterium]